MTTSPLAVFLKSLFYRVFPPKAAPEPPVSDLIERALARLPLSPALLMSQARDRLSDVSDIGVLSDQYADLSRHPAWVHFVGRLLAMKGSVEDMILRGERNRFGEDMTPQFRSTYGIILQILAIPAQVEQAKLEAEATLLGPSPAPAADNEPPTV